MNKHSSFILELFFFFWNLNICQIVITSIVFLSFCQVYFKIIAQDGNKKNKTKHNMFRMCDVSAFYLERASSKFEFQITFQKHANYSLPPLSQ